jgi:Zn-dependent peptidase ImmA (M78 family)
MQIRNFTEANLEIKKLVNQVKDQIGINASYQYLGINDPVANLLDIEVLEKQLPRGVYGYYIPPTSQHNKHSILINLNCSNQERLNFTFFHEITHCLIKGDDDLYSFFDNSATANATLENLIEKYADFGAAEFLVPSDFVKELISEEGFSMKLFPRIYQHFQASKPAIVFQLAQCAPHKCFIVICKEDLIPTTVENQTGFFGELGSYEKCLFLEYTAASPTNRYSLARNTRIPKGHLIEKVFLSEDDRRGNDVIPFRSKVSWEVDCDAVFYKGKVYAAFNLTEPKTVNRLQLSLL